MFAKPHKYTTYGIVSSTTPSDDESEDTPPRLTLLGIFEASSIQRCRRAVCLSYHAGSFGTRDTDAHIYLSGCIDRLKKRKRGEPPARDAFSCIVEKVCDACPSVTLLC